MGRWDIYWGPAHILIHPWDGWMSGRGGGGPLLVRISNRQDGGGNELLPGAGGGDPPTSQDPAAQRQQTNNISAPCHSPSADVLWSWDTSWHVHVKSVSWILKNACFIFLIARTSTLLTFDTHSFGNGFIFLADPSSIIALPCPSFSHSLLFMTVRLDLSKLLNGFVKIDTWISLSCYKDLLKFQYGFVKVVTWICQTCSMF